MRFACRCGIEDSGRLSAFNHIRAGSRNGCHGSFLVLIAGSTGWASVCGHAWLISRSVSISSKPYKPGSSGPIEMHFAEDGGLVAGRFNCLAIVGLAGSSDVLSVVTPAAWGIWPVKNDCREGVQTGELQ